MNEIQNGISQHFDVCIKYFCEYGNWLERYLAVHGYWVGIQLSRLALTRQEGEQIEVTQHNCQNVHLIQYGELWNQMAGNELTLEL